MGMDKYCDEGKGVGEVLLTHQSLSPGVCKAGHLAWVWTGKVMKGRVWQRCC